MAGAAISSMTQRRGERDRARVGAARRRSSAATPRRLVASAPLPSAGRAVPPAAPLPRLAAPLVAPPAAAWGAAPAWLLVRLHHSLRRRSRLAAPAAGLARGCAVPAPPAVVPSQRRRGVPVVRRRRPSRPPARPREARAGERRAARAAGSARRASPAAPRSRPRAPRRRGSRRPAASSRAARSRRSAGEQHGAPGGVHRLDDRLARPARGWGRGGGRPRGSG